MSTIYKKLKETIEMQYLISKSVTCTVYYNKYWHKTFTFWQCVKTVWKVTLTRSCFLGGKTVWCFQVQLSPRPVPQCGCGGIPPGGRHELARHLQQIWIRVRIYNNKYGYRWEYTANMDTGENIQKIWIRVRIYCTTNMDTGENIQPIWI